MKKLIVLACSLFLASSLSHLNAQSINNRNWKAFFNEPFNDTLVFHVHSDSSFVTNNKGGQLLRTSCTIIGDTLILSDYGTGEHSCPDMKGKYKIQTNGNSFRLALIEDPCDGRARALDGVKWTEAK